MSYGNWKHILAVFSFHNSVFNGIFLIKHTWRDPLVRSAAPFDPFFFIGFLLSLTGFFLSFFFSPFFFHWSPLAGFFLSFFFFTSSFHRSPLVGFFFFFFTGFSKFGFLFFFLFFHWVRWVWVLEKKKKLHWVTGMGPQTVWKILSDDKWVMVPNG